MRHSEVAKNGPVVPKAYSFLLLKHSFASPDWDGFATRRIGLEMQSPWAGHLLSGRKTVETRQYDLPKTLLNRRIEVLESRKGKDGGEGARALEAASCEGTAFTY